MELRPFFSEERTWGRNGAGRGPCCPEGRGVRLHLPAAQPNASRDTRPAPRRRAGAALRAGLRRLRQGQAGLCSVQAQRPQTVLAASLRTGDVRWGSGETCLCVLARSAPRQAAGGRELPERCIPFPRSSQAASGGRVEGEPPGPGPDAPVPALLASVLLRASLQATRFWLCWMPSAPPHRFLSVFPLSCPMLAASGSFLGPLPQMPSCLCSRR